MKRVIGIVVVLCVVAPASFGAYLDEYTWTGANGNFVDETWSVKTNDPCGAASRPKVPFESGNTTDWTNYARPQLTNGGTVTINTDLAPLDYGFQQFQISKGTIIVDTDGELRIHDGYLHCSTNTAAQGLIVQNGGKYYNSGTGTGNQVGHMGTYTTLNSKGFTTISGTGTVFDTYYWYSGRYSSTVTRFQAVNVLGSGSTINVNTFAPGGNNTTTTLNFTADAVGVSAINIASKLAFQQGVGGTSYTANKTLLDFAITSAPAVGQQFVLFDLAAGATRTGLMKNLAGSTLGEGCVIGAWLGGFGVGTEYYFQVSYVGGATGNDVVLTAIPEPATIGLLSLGGLILARRRRA